MPSQFSSVLTGVTMISSSLLLGAFFVHWLTDHSTIWTPVVPVPDAIVRSSLVYYSQVFQAPGWYPAALLATLGAALLATFLKLASNGRSGILFDSASFMLLLSALAVYTTNVRAALDYLPLENLPSSWTPLDAHITEALQSIAASHMIIAVSLTGVLSLQAAQSYSNKPTAPVELVQSPPAAAAAASGSGKKSQ